MNILVTGAAGFLGYHLCAKLLAEGHTVVGIDNMMSGQQQNIDTLSAHAKFSFQNVDIIELPSFLAGNNSFAKNLANLDRIYHMACPASPPIYQTNPLHTLETCFTGSRNIFALAQRTGARVLIASTSEIYGDPEVHPQPESYRGNVNTMGPRSCYDEGKRIMETLGHEYSKLGVQVRTARIFNTYGPRMSPIDGRVLTNFISQALEGKDLTVFGDGTQTRSFCFYADLVRGLNLLMESDVVEPVNLGSQYEFTILQVAEAVRALINGNLKIVHVALPQDDPKIRRPDTSQAFKLLGWQTEVNLHDGMKVMVEDFRSRLKNAH